MWLLVTLLACTIVPDGDNWVGADCTLEELIEWATPRGIGAGAVQPPPSPMGIMLQ